MLAEDCEPAVAPVIVKDPLQTPFSNNDDGTGDGVRKLANA